MPESSSVCNTTQHSTAQKPHSNNISKSNNTSRNNSSSVSYVDAAGGNMLAMSCLLVDAAIRVYKLMFFTWN